ncbi:hypothetical protein [Motiliproteus sp. SC1-56]|uniref:hypothetical protein n=1 Tax=Motiliproteus sp. SC1-56 TaxID=2799565 RepID=UPI001A8F3882|nr:hypothetical protein [Motiliproteus sp. SC1-56]
MPRLAVLLMLVIPLAACETPQVKPHGYHYHSINFLTQARQAREKAMQEHWIGKPVREVKQSLGEPRVTMSIPGTFGSSVLMYGVIDQHTQCIDAFRYLEGDEPRVTNYFCR